MRIVRALICAAALGSMSASACFAHAWLGRAALGVGHGSRLIDDSNTNRKSKLPCNSEHPPAYCKPNSGSK